MGDPVRSTTRRAAVSIPGCRGASSGLSLAAAVSAVLLSSACQPATPPVAAPGALAADAAIQLAATKAAISIEPATGASEIRPDAPVIIRATTGRLVQVRVADARGRVVPGELSADGTLWESSGGLAPKTTYRASARAVTAGGSETDATSTFRTLKAAKTVTTYISPLQNQTVGVGMPVIVRFSEPVAHRADAERRLSVRPSVPVEGAWSWISDREVHWRPKQYWPAHTDVTLHVGTAGLETAPGTWGEADRTVSFKVGAAMVSTVDARTLRMTVTRDGKVARTIPVTTGKKGFITRSGIKVISEKYRKKIMDGATVNISRSSSEYYRLEVPYAMRVTNSGEFVHGAPWSEGQQGRARVSHGCVGMSEKNAAWFFGLTSIGDIVEVVGTGRPLEPNNGWTDWNTDWAAWQAGSALS